MATKPRAGATGATGADQYAPGGVAQQMHDLVGMTGPYDQYSQEGGARGQVLDAAGVTGPNQYYAGGVAQQVVDTVAAATGPTGSTGATGATGASGAT